MTTKSLKERQTGRTKNIALECAKNAMNMPGIEIGCWDHDQINTTAHLSVASMASGVLTALSIPHKLQNNFITVVPYK